MAGWPACTLLHLGPGLGNGLANLHNARRARTPVVNIVGDHATYHRRLDPPLESDIVSVARTVSPWTRVSTRAVDVAADSAHAILAACGPPGSVATLVLPADVSWTELDATGDPTSPGPPARSGVRSTPVRSVVPEDTVARTAKILQSGEPTTLLLGGSVLRAEGLRRADALARATGATLLCETFPARLERGAGLPSVDRLGYLAEFALAQLAGARHLVLVDAASPVSFFAYPGVVGDLTPPGCEVHTLAGPADDGVRALEAVGDLLGLGNRTPGDGGPTADGGPGPARPDAPSGPITMASLAHRRHLPGRRDRRSPPPRLALPGGWGHRPGPAPGHRGLGGRA
jgi:acetolactate synthase-1/2/3 large subunit